MTHLLLLTLAVFYFWETARAILPFALPGWANAALIFGFAWASSTYLTDHWLALVAVAAVVAVLHQKFGAEHKVRSFHLPYSGRKVAAQMSGRIPPLP